MSQRAERLRRGRHGLTRAEGEQSQRNRMLQATAYLDLLAEQPALSRVFLVEVYAAGPEAMDRRAAFQANIVRELARLLEVDDEDGRFACEMLVAAVSTMVTRPLVKGDLEALRALRRPVISVVRRALETTG